MSYSDANFAADKSDRRSLTEGITLLNGIAVSWSAKKQGVVSLSTIYAKFVAEPEVARELLGVREMLCELTCFQVANADALTTKLLYNTLRVKHRCSRHNILIFESILFAILPGAKL